MNTDPLIAAKLQELRRLIDQQLGWPESNTAVFRKITDAGTGLVVIAAQWSGPAVQGIDRKLIEEGCDIRRMEDWLIVGPWLCRIVREDEQTVWVERTGE